MKEGKEKIDLLFERNAEEQLTGVDWNELNAAISSRLDQAQKSKTSVRKYPTVFKIAAGIAAAAVVFITVTVKTEKPADVQLDKGISAVVKFIDKKGSASIEIKRPSGKSQVMVDIGSSQRKVARCDVEIIDLNGGLRKGSDEAAWIIISRPEPVLADNGVSRYNADLIYLF
ncbi:MAG: hypothetical protein DRP62_02730 [Planctomycetota bacterium]|nr:MAG: hypothetical protein DRP62_02730 [Planctomycetota bacterium]